MGRLLFYHQKPRITPIKVSQRAGLAPPMVSYALRPRVQWVEGDMDT